MIVLGIETSCDETAAALVDGGGIVRAEAVLSQLDEHRPFGGVVPEVAARAHLAHLDRLVARVMEEAGIGFAGLSGVAATTGPGLIGGLMVGATMGKAIALAHGLPFVAVNHLEGHALSPRLSHGTPFPYLLLLVSGGHCQFLAVAGVGRYRQIGTTVDDAVGEAFDKVAKMLGLGYPGGPAVEAAAAAGDPARFPFPRPMLGRPGADLSLSGLKTAVRQAVEALPPGPLDGQDRADLCASFQAAVADLLEDRCRNAMDLFAGDHAQARTLVLAGGVAANAALRARFARLAEERGWTLVIPPARWCTDNAAMVAWAGVERLRLGLSDPLESACRPRWPLDPAAGWKNRPMRAAE